LAELQRGHVARAAAPPLDSARHAMYIRPTMLMTAEQRRRLHRAVRLLDPGRQQRRARTLCRLFCCCCKRPLLRNRQRRRHCACTGTRWLLASVAGGICRRTTAESCRRAAPTGPQRISAIDDDSGGGRRRGVPCAAARAWLWWAAAERTPSVNVRVRAAFVNHPHTFLRSTPSLRPAALFAACALSRRVEPHMSCFIMRGMRAAGSPAQHTNCASTSGDPSS
jgi:hypothetical protein